MIKSNELRIGNWVNYLGTPTQLLTGKQIDDNYKVINPIPLTPELLENAGFEYEGATTLTKEKFPVYFKSNGGLLFAFAFYLQTNVDVRCEYVHQLQNLYLDLTGEELTINFKDLTYQ